MKRPMARRFFCHRCGRMISFSKGNRKDAVRRHFRKHHKKKI